MADLTPQQQTVFQQVLQQYPEFAPLFQAVPELRDLFTLSIGGHWTTTKFAEELHKTQWWQNTPESARLWAATTVSDPAQANRQRQQATNDYYRIASQEGVTVTADQMKWIVETSLSQGLSADEIRDGILSLAKQNDPATGGLDSTMTQLKSIAADYGVPVSEKNLFSTARDIRTNRTTTDAFSEEMKQRALDLFPAFSDSLERGRTMAQIADPYANLATSMLEISPDQFDLTDPKWQRILQSRDKNGVVQRNSLSDAQNILVNDPKYGWDHTSQAKGEALDMVNQLGQSFGVL